jgi:hypothetical protein
MRAGLFAWALTLSGLIAWAVHFGGLYAVASWMDLDPSNAVPGRWLGAILSLACLTATALAALLTRRDTSLSPTLRWIALTACTIAALAILFQTAPLLFL